MRADEMTSKISKCSKPSNAPPKDAVGGNSIDNIITHALTVEDSAVIQDVHALHVLSSKALMKR